MRLSALPILLTGASLIQYATASPIRVVVVTSNQEVSSNIRFEDGPTPFFAQPLRAVPAPTIPQPEQGAGRHRGCGLKSKALAVSNKLREMFGLPPISAAPEHHTMHNVNNDVGEIKILPFIGTPTPVEYHPDMYRNKSSMPSGQGGVVRIMRPNGMGHHRPHFQRSFLHRVHRALMVLGPWEGRAVAFVLGCGIGVLLRMFWVMTILLFRSFRGGRNSDDADVHDVLVFEADAEDILVPPPQYTDEKAPIAVEENKPEVKA